MSNESSHASGATATVLPAAIASGSLIAQHVAGRATRDALFLTHFGLDRLPAAMIGAAVVSSLAVAFISRALARHGPARVVPAMFAIGAVFFLLEWCLSAYAMRATAIVVYAHTAVFGAAGVSAFWSLVNERFDPRVAKRVVGRIASGGTLGGVLGGVLAWRASAHVALPMMLALLAAMNVVGLWGALRTIPKAARAEPPEEPFRGGGVRALGETPYLRDLALLVTAGAVVQALLDWLLSAQATLHYGRGQELLAFFALFNMVVGIGAFAAQAALARPLLERIGLAGTAKIEPAGVAIGAAVALALPRLSSIVVLRWIEAVVRNSLYRSAYELFYTPLPTAKKRAAKALVDVGFDRIGTTVGGLGLFGIAYLEPASATRAVLAGAMATSVLAWLLASRLHDGYVAALAASLKAGAVSLEHDDAYDLTTRRTLAETTTLLDREKLLAEIELLQRAKGGEGDASAEAPEASERVTTLDPIVGRAAALRSGDARRVKAELASPLPPILAPFAVPLLADDAVARDVVRALRRVAPKVTGLLVDTLLDPDTDPRVRRRIPRVLKVVRTQRATAGLVLALSDASFEVRVQVGLALAQLKEETDVHVDRSAIFDVALRELTDGRAGWKTSPPSPELATTPPEGGDAVHRGLSHVFTVLGLVLEREPLAIAFRTLRSDDSALRGTALEYLEVVLPGRLRDVIVPLLGEVETTRERLRDAGVRPPSELAKELLRSQETSRKALGSIAD